MKRIQAAQFEPVEAEAEFSFGVTDGDDETAVSVRAGLAATRMVEAMIQNKLGAVEVAPPASKGSPAAGEAAARLDAAVAKARKARTTPPAAPKSALQEDGERAEAAQTKPAEDDLGLEDDSPNTVEVLHTENTKVEVDELDLGGDDPTSAAPTEVTDKELTDAITRRNGELIKVYAEKHNGDGKLGTRRIRELIASYHVAQAREIPQEKRGAFLAELSALAYEKPKA